MYVVYGDVSYLKDAYASAITLRRHDKNRPIAIACEDAHRTFIKENNLSIFDEVVLLKPEHRSIVGFKHNFYEYLIFDRTLFIDSDIVWCKNPDALWTQFSAFPFTATGNVLADIFFGAPKNLGIVFDFIANRRKRTLKRFDLSYLSRVQSGMMFGQDKDVTQQVCETAKEMLAKKAETHFNSRLNESGRNEESCEWSLALAMAKLNRPVFQWHQGMNSPQVDFIEDLTDYDPDFNSVIYRKFTHPFLYSLRGIKTGWVRKCLIHFFSIMPGWSDYVEFVPYCLHFGWYHQKEPFKVFSKKKWEHMLTNQKAS